MSRKLACMCVSMYVVHVCMDGWMYICICICVYGYVCSCVRIFLNKMSSADTGKQELPGDKKRKERKL